MSDNGFTRYPDEETSCRPTSCTWYEDDNGNEAVFYQGNESVNLNINLGPLSDMSKLGVLESVLNALYPAAVGQAIFAELENGLPDGLNPTEGSAAGYGYLMGAYPSDQNDMYLHLMLNTER
jgi:hypothetical protein